VSCRGSRHDNLAEFGDTFEVIPYENKEGYFKLKGNIEKEDDIVDIPDEISTSEEDDLDISASDEGNEIDFNLDF
jgi:hypothetical protein